ncbi:MAG: chromosomal replication initiator protein DnaA [Bacteroidales bacterium]
MRTHQEVWTACQAIIKDNVTEETYNNLFKKIASLSLVESKLTVQVPSHFVYEYIEENYLDLLSKTIRKELGSDAQLEYSITVAGQAMRPIPQQSSETPRNKPVSLMQAGEKPLTSFNPFVIPGLRKLEIDPQLDPKYAFENYIEGESNKLARSVGLEIAKKPGESAFNPLFVYGGTGLGKTHLAQAIGLEVKKLHPEKVVLYVNANKFKEQYTNAAALKNDINSFLHFYQMVDVLILDDVHDFATQAKTQNAFFHIFDQLHRSKKQIILTCDKAPVEIEGFEPRILSRFKWGLSAEITPPDYQTRLAIFRYKIYKDGIDLEDEIIEFLANKITNNIREFEGVLNRLLAEATFNKKAITMSMVMNVVNQNIRSHQKELSITGVYKSICEYLNVPFELAQSKTRKREVVQVRQIAMYFCKSLTKSSLSSIGEHIGGKNHATVLHACKQVTNQIETDRGYSEMVATLERKLKMA